MIPQNPRTQVPKTLFSQFPLVPFHLLVIVVHLGLDLCLEVCELCLELLVVLEAGSAIQLRINSFC